MGVMPRTSSSRRQASRFKVSSRRKSKTSTRKGTYKPYSNTRGTNPANLTVFRGIGFPDKLTTNLVYSESIILTPSVGTPTPFVTYKATSLFDPNEALGGGQPTYFDQLAGIYQRYKVNGCKMTCYFSLTSGPTAGTGPYLVGIQASDSTLLPTNDVGVLISAPNTTFRVVNLEDGTKSVVQTYSPKNTFEFFDDSLQARTNTNPLINWYLKPFASPQGTIVNVPINVVIIMEFNATFSTVQQVVDA